MPTPQQIEFAARQLERAAEYFSFRADVFARNPPEKYETRRAAGGETVGGFTFADPAADPTIVYLNGVAADMRKAAAGLRGKDGR